ncbi:hypothetical protein [Alkaliphilus transvaalensis]|uniref:hypothetical protein n=1 Tax=Alkaliphilus transvaalensis TaxID=114628 RepID=UPI00047B2EEE|nr:hypothetical protein [Alkaliphilus transvaalensis]
MKLQELVEMIQNDLEEGVKSFVVWQEGRKWKIEEFKTNTDEELEVSEKRYFTLKHRIDDQAIIINGKKHFKNYDMKSIQSQIKKLRG